jgi:monothiol glutaredoxin
MDVLERIRAQVTQHPVIIYMKGSPTFPQCGFSARAVEALKQCGVKFAFVNVLADPEIYQHLPSFANWPTFPQIYIDGDLIGGCDITLEMFESGELQTLIKAAFEKHHADKA